MKKLFGEGGIKGFFAHHVEKILLGLTALIGLYLVWSGYQTEGLDSGKDPGSLSSAVTQARQHMEGFGWDDYSNDRRKVSIFRSVPGMPSPKFRSRPTASTRIAC